MNTSQEHVLQRFAEQLPSRPYATNDLAFGLKVHSRQRSLGMRYVQPNHPQLLRYIVLDVDYVGAGSSWLDSELPRPTITAVNPDNGHAHLSYELEMPVPIDPQRPATRYLAAVQRGMTARLGADQGYSGLITKNPVSRFWPVQTYDRRYTLREIGDRIDASEMAIRPRLVAGIGRNCALFDALRFWAYASVREFGDETSWRDAVANAATQSNAFPEPLGPGEVRGIVKSVSRWVWSHREQFASRRLVRRGALGFEPLPPVMEATRRLEEVSRRRSLAGAASASSVRAGVAARIDTAVESLGSGSTVAAIAAAAGVSDRTVQRHRARSPQATLPAAQWGAIPDSTVCHLSAPSEVAA